MSSTQPNILDAFGNCVYLGDEVVFTMSVSNSKKDVLYIGTVVELRNKIKVEITKTQVAVSQYSVGDLVWAYPYRTVAV